MTGASSPGRRWLWRLGLPLVVAGLVLVAVHQRAGRPGTPTGAVELSDGSRLDLAHRPGEVVVLNFWASWCAPCRAEAPELSRVHRKLTARGVGRVVGLAVEAISPAEARDHADRFGLRLPVAPVEPGWADPFDVQVLPTTVVLAPDGSVRRRFVGAVRARDLLASIPEAHGNNPQRPPR